MLGKQDACCYWTDLNGKITPLFRQLYQETISDLQMELKAALVDLGHKSAFHLLMKEANSKRNLIGYKQVYRGCDSIVLKQRLALPSL